MTTHTYFERITHVHSRGVNPCAAHKHFHKNYLIDFFLSFFISPFFKKPFLDQAREQVLREYQCVKEISNELAQFKQRAEPEGKRPGNPHLRKSILHCCRRSFPLILNRFSCTRG